MVRTLLLLLVLSGNVWAQASAPQASDILVYFKDQATLPKTASKRVIYRTLVNIAERSQARTSRLLRNENIEHRSFHVANVIAAYNVSTELRKRLEQLPEVAFVVDNRVTQLRLPPVQWQLTTASDIPEQIQMIGVDKVWNMGVTGKGIVVGSIDSGVMWDHEALKSRYRGYSSTGVSHDYNWHDAITKPISPGPSDAQTCAFNSAEPCDDVDHGTHTVGTMVGEEKGRERFGVAPDAKWIACRGLEKGWGSVATYLDCLEYFLAPYPRGGDPKKDGRPDLAPNIINISWICEGKEGCQRGDELLSAVQALKAAGILIVVAAGNDGPDCKSINHSPAHYSKEVLTVGAYDHRDDTIAEFSGRGPSDFDGGLVPAVTAPGKFLRSSVPGGRNGSYDFKSGTSMAAPHVTGVAALIWSAKPQLIGKVQETIELIEKTATPRTSSQSCGSFSGGKIPNAVYGYGIVDAYAAVK